MNNGKCDLLDEENDWGWLWWHDILEEEEQEQKECPECGSKRIYFNRDRRLWVCLDCNYEWKSEEE
ncbi:hypothetical protein DRO69_08465 [Candidatus Bathyarchaeota archaeon]|nr:MAG: hypothetical protein DRO69_08465 [Candidatus Bathyarchaeota archaeon]